ncbi:MAG: hypothetical protein NVV72_10835 [Asticcacaulis sp.]|nr:hypothetical protein [Asticcacaulis sp.]
MDDFLFDSRQKRDLILLDPFKVELRNFLETITNQQIVNVTNRISRPHELDAMRASPLFARIESLSDRVRNESYNLTPEELEFVKAFVRENVPNFLQSGPPDVRRRLHDVFERGNVRLGANIRELVGDGDTATYKRWFDALNEVRSDKTANNAVDASAISLIYALNDYYRRNRRGEVRFVLTTRSELMNTIASHPEELVHWAEIGGNPIRHPRAALVMLGDDAEVVHAGDIRLGRVLEKWGPRWQLGEELRDLDTSQARGSLTQTELARRRQALKAHHLDTLRRGWQDYIGLKVSRYALDKRRAEPNILRILSAITDQAEYRRYVVQSLDDMFEAMTMSKVMLQLYDQREIVDAFSRDPGGEPSQKRAAEDSRTKMIGELKPLTLRIAHGPRLPFSVYISYSRVLHMAAEVGGDPLKLLPELGEEALLPWKLPMDDENDQRQISYEWYLVVAYTGAAIGAWKFAMRICEWLTHELDVNVLKISRKKADGAFAEIYHEAALFRVRCLRYTSSEGANLRDAHELVSGIIEKAPKARPMRERYFAERLKLRYLILTSDLEAGRQAKARLQFEPRDIFEQTNDHIERSRKADATEALCQNYNNKIYHCLELYEHFRAFYSPSEIIADIEKLEALLVSQFSDDTREWPDNFVDTVAYSRLRLCILLAGGGDGFHGGD